MHEHTDDLQDSTSDPSAPHRSSIPRMENTPLPQSYRPRLEEYRARLRPQLEVLRLRAVSSMKQASEHISSGTLKKDTADLIQRAQQRGQAALRDRLQNLRHARSSIPDADVPQDSSFPVLEQEAESHRAKLLTSVTALRKRATSTVADVRQRVSPDALRQETAAYAERARKAGVTALAERMRRRPFGTAALGAGLGLSAWHRLRAAPASLLLTAAGAVSLLRAGAQKDQEASTSAGALHPMRHDGSLRAPLAASGQLIASTELPVGAAEPEPSHAMQSRQSAVVRTSPSPPVSAMTRIRNDVLVRTALERPVLVGAATIALGALIGSLSSAGATRREGMLGRRGRTAGAPTTAVEVKRGDTAPAADNRSHPEGTDAGRIDEQNAALSGIASQKVSAKEADAAAGPFVSKVVDALVNDSERPKTSASEAKTPVVEIGSAAAQALEPSAIAEPKAPAATLFIGEASEVSDLGVASVRAEATRQQKSTGHEARAQPGGTTSSTSQTPGRPEASGAKDVTD